MTSSIEFRRPGVEVREAILPRETGGVNTGRARSVIAGKFAKGPTGPTAVNSWLQFQNLFGGWINNPDHDFAVDAVYGYFSNAGVASAQLTILRLIGTGAEAAKATVGGIKFEAMSAGKWGDDIRVTVNPVDSTGRGTFSPRQFDDDEFDARAGESEGLVNVRVQLGETGIPEVFRNLSLDPLAKNWLKATINNQSTLVRVVDSPTSATPEGPVNLDGGDDGKALDVSASLKQLDSVASPILLYVAAQKDNDADPEIQKAGTQYVAVGERSDSFCVVDVPRFQNEPVDTPDSVVTVDVAANPFAAAYWPWIEVIDPLRGATNVRKVVAPGGSVLGAIADVDARIGPWRTPAGVAVPLKNAVNVDRRLTESELVSLNSRSKPINAIRPVGGAGVCIMGGRTLDQTNSDRYVGVRRSLNFITANLRAISETALFEPNGPDLWQRLTNQMNDWLGRYYQQGALRGAREPEAFRVIIDESNNTPGTVAAGELHIEVGVAVEFPAEFVIIRLVQHQSSVRN